MCISIIAFRVTVSGRPIYIFLSILPGLVSAESNKSIRFVAETKKIPVLFLNPSSSTSNAFSVESLSFDELSPSVDLLRPTASISSINIIQGTFCFANLNSSFILLDPTPTYFS